MVLLFCSCSEEELVASTADGGLACKTREELLFLFFRCFAFLLSDLNSESQLTNVKLHKRRWRLFVVSKPWRRQKRETERTNQIDYCEEVQKFTTSSKINSICCFRHEEEEEANLNKCFREAPKILFRTDANSRRFQRIWPHLLCSAFASSSSSSSCSVLGRSAAP